jgi:threonine synthase
MIILDLMMPDLDGFSVLEALKADEDTQNIPVIVVSAKDITEDEWKRLHGQIEGHYQKGLLPPMEFVEQVVEVIEQKGSKGDVK